MKRSLWTKPAKAIGAEQDIAREFFERPIHLAFIGFSEYP
jgi:hypothetical protein